MDDDVPVQISPAPSRRRGDNARTNRQLRKREQDRLAQRAARERNKERIAELEAAVARLSKQGGSGEVITSLEEKLAHVTRQRDRLAKSLDAIQNIIRCLLPISDQVCSLESPPGAGSETTGNAVAAAQVSAPCSPAVDPLLQGAEDDDVSQNVLPITPANDTMGILHDVGVFDAPDLVSFVPSPFPTQDPIQPKPRTWCECVSPIQGHGKEAVSPSIWWNANVILGNSQTMSEPSLVYEQQMSQDSAVRAVLHGWDTLGAPGSLSPMWDKLRRIDKLQFSSCRNVERLAIMLTMHSLLLFHARPTEEQRVKIPDWYLQRPSTEMSYSYATDFFVWPALRARFVVSQHRYCSNHFWRAFISSFRLLWPHDFRDCYRLNLETGRYSLSADFMNHVRDLRLWTMQNDFFNSFPNLRSDIPLAEYIARSPSWTDPGQLILSQEHLRSRDRDSEYTSEDHSQFAEQSVTECWDEPVFAQGRPPQSLPQWAQEAVGIDHSSTAERESTSWNRLPGF